MMTSTFPESYNTIAKALHWTIAVLIIGMLALGWIMTDLPNGSQKFYFFQMHKSFGILILVLSCFRLFWRISHKTPALPTTMMNWEIWVAKLTHGLFYFLIIGMPLTGWVIVSTSALNIKTILFGFIPWPHLPIISELANKKQIGDLFEGAHSFSAWVILILLFLHVGAGLKHHFINRDDILLRMAPKMCHRLLRKLGGR